MVRAVLRLGFVCLSIVMGSAGTTMAATPALPPGKYVVTGERNSVRWQVTVGDHQCVQAQTYPCETSSSGGLAQVNARASAIARGNVISFRAVRNVFEGDWYEYGADGSGFSCRYAAPSSPTVQFRFARAGANVLRVELVMPPAFAQPITDSSCSDGTSRTFTPPLKSFAPFLNARVKRGDLENGRAVKITWGRSDLAPETRQVNDLKVQWRGIFTIKRLGA